MLSAPQLLWGGPQQNFNGNFDLYGNMTIYGGNLSGGQGYTNCRVMAPGVTMLHNSSTVVVDTASTYSTTRFSYEQNITQAAHSTLSLMSGISSGGQVEFSGDNRGLTGGIVLLAHPSVPNPLIFLNANALGGGTVTVNSNAYAGLAFDFTSNTVAGMIFQDSAVLGIESNSSVDINLSASGLNKDIWLGSSRGPIYTGRLTPAGTTYKLGGGDRKAHV